MENKDNKSIIIIGIHVHDIKWKGLNPSEQAYLPLETDLPFKGEYYDQPSGKPTTSVVGSTSIRGR